MERIEAYASQSVTLKVALRQGGAAYSGKTIVVDILQADGTLLVDGGSCTEVGSTGVYYYTYTTPSTAQSLTVEFYEGTSPMGNPISLEVLSTIASAASGDSSLFTTVDNMVTRVNLALNKHNFPYTNALTTQYINEAIQYLQRRFTLLADEFVYNITTTSLYQVDSQIPYPYEVEDIWYNTGSSEVPIIWRDRVTVKAKVASGSATITGYNAYKDTYKHYVQLDGTPAAGITSGLRIKGPYMPLYVSSGQSLPIEKKYDAAVEAVAIEKAINEYSQDPEEVRMVAENRENVCRRVGLTEGEDRSSRYAANA